MSFSTLAAQHVHTYCRAKDGNRPHLLATAFADDAWLEWAVDGALLFPHSVSQGREAITRSLVGHFGRTCENVYTFCLQRPGEQGSASQFSCDWLAGMSAKDSGQVRVGCGRYDWQFQHEPPHRVQGLKISVAVMKVLPPPALATVTEWLAGLPYPWCQAAAMAAAAPDLPALQPVLEHLCRRSAPGTCRPLGQVVSAYAVSRSAP